MALVTVGSVSRKEASQTFSFLQENFRGRRKEIKEYTHTYPLFVFWVFPNGTLFDAKEAHKKNVPAGYQYILKDTFNYGGFLRGRLASQFDEQLLVVYCQPEVLSQNIPKIKQFLKGMTQVPLPIDEHCLVISDNGDIYGTITDLEIRVESNE